MNRLFDDIYDVARESLEPIRKDPANRGRSWDRCYSFFQKYHRWDEAERQRNVELACLHLGFYMASWGMFRGSGSLIHKDYTIYEGVINKLLEEQYRALWQDNYFQELLTTDVPIINNNQEVKLIFQLADEIREYIRSQSIIRKHEKEPKQVKSEQAKATNTIITKILMGTMCCTPAYDDYFTHGVAARVRGCGSFTISSFVRLLNICRERKLWEKLQDKSIKCHIVYPFMRVVDLYFWTKGFDSRNAS